MTVLFSDNTKFKKVTKDTTLTQLTTLQNYLRTIKSRDKITQDKHETMRPTSITIARGSFLELVILQSLVTKCCKIRKI